MAAESLTLADHADALEQQVEQLKENRHERALRLAQLDAQLARIDVAVAALRGKVPRRMAPVGNGVGLSRRRLPGQGQVMHVEKSGAKKYVPSDESFDRVRAVFDKADKGAEIQQKVITERSGVSGGVVGTVLKILREQGEVERREYPKAGMGSAVGRPSPLWRRVL